MRVRSQRRCGSLKAAKERRTIESGSKVVTLNNVKFAVFEDTTDSFVWFCLCFAFDE